MNDGKSTQLASHNGRRVAKVRTARKLFDDVQKQLFLEELAATCNVTHSAKVAGVVVNTPYNHRMRDPAFRAAWDLALEQGYAKLEAEMLARATRVIPVAGDREREGEIDWDKGMDLLRLHRAAVKKSAHAPRFEPIPVEEARAMLIAKLRAIGVLPKA